MKSRERNAKLTAAALILSCLAAGTSQAAAAQQVADEMAQPRSGRVVIKRDDYGAPNVYADDLYSLYYGYGYALAEDRLFQIESHRRASTGRAAEVFGAEYIEIDKATLRNFDPDTLNPQMETLSGEYNEVLGGMVAGVNAYIREALANRDTLLPKQFIDYGFDPQPNWTKRDIVMCWMGHLLFQFSDYTAQISNTAFLTRLSDMHGEEKAKEVFSALRWNYDPASPTTVQMEDYRERKAANGAARGTLPLWANYNAISPEAAEAHARFSIVLWGGDGPDHTPSASNTWLVNDGKLADADSIMVSGPQVGDWVPSKIWAASLHGAGLDVVGTTYPGLPYFHFGTNGDIAWGRTALAGSTLDTYREELNPDNPHQYKYNGEWRDMETRTETFAVKGGEPVSAEMYSTVHGPVIAFDEENGVAYAKKRTWTGYELQTMFAYYEEMKARNYDDWAKAISRKTNNQSQYYADKEGNIAFLQAGRYPIRPEGYNVHLPSPGDGGMEWQGAQPFSENARVFNPKQGYIANWNNRPSPEIMNTDTLLWSQLHRVDAINVELEAKEALTVQEIWDINSRTSYASELHRYFVPLIREAVASGRVNERTRRAAELIASWDGQETDPTYTGYHIAPGQTVFYEWLATAMTAFFEKDLPKDYLGGCGKGPSYNCPYGQPTGASVLYFALTEGETGSPEPAYDFLHGRDPDDFIRHTLRDAEKSLTKEYGKDMSRWQAPTVAKTWESKSPSDVPWAGGDERFEFRPNQKRGAMNAMYVFRNGEVSMCDANPPGQSGFIAPDGTKSPHYSDQLALYTSFDCKPRRITKEEVDANAASVRTLEF